MRRHVHHHTGEVPLSVVVTDPGANMYGSARVYAFVGCAASTAFLCFCCVACIAGLLWRTNVAVLPFLLHTSSACDGHASNKPYLVALMHRRCRMM